MSAERADFGARLRQAREAQGLSLKDIATATKISVLVLEALERNDVSRLPGGLFSRAFLRAYAKEVRLDPEQTVREFTERFSETDDSARPDDDERARSARGDLNAGIGHSGLRWLGLAVTLLLVVVWIAVDRYYGNRGQPAPTATSRAAARRPVARAPAKPSSLPESQPTTGSGTGQPGPGQAPPASVPVQGAQPANTTVGQAPRPAGEDRARAPSPSQAPNALQVPGAAQATNAPQSPNAPQVPAQPTPAQLPAQTANPIVVDPTLPLQIVISPQSSCWVSARVDGNRIVGRTVQPGEKLQLSAAKVIVLTAGNAAALSYTVNGAPGRSLGGSGEVVTVVITTNNYRTYMTGRQ